VEADVTTLDDLGVAPVCPGSFGAPTLSMLDLLAARTGGG